MTEYWKTDHNVTLGQLHFIGPANSHTHTLPMHYCINGLSQLVCFSRAGFANRVKSRLRQWDPWRELDGRCGSDIPPCVRETSLKALQSCLGLRIALLGLIATPNSPVGRCSPPLASHPPHPHPTCPLHPPHPLPPPAPPAPSIHPTHSLHPPHPPPPPTPPAHPLMCAICDITVVVKKLLKIKQC